MQQTMTRVVAIALALTLTTAPIANVMCAAWCDARASETGGASPVCHSDLNHGAFAVIANLGACGALTGTPFVGEDVRRPAPHAITFDLVFLPMSLDSPGYCMRGRVSAGTERSSASHAHGLVLRI